MSRGGKNINSFPRVNQASYNKLFEKKNQSSKFIFVIFLFIIFIITTIVVVFLFIKPNDSNNVEVLQATIDDDVINVLPGYEEDANDVVKNSVVGDDKTRENIAFGDFYNKQIDGFKSSLTTYELPINIKANVVNYYNISRKIDIDNLVNDLNSDGFVVSENNIVNQNKDFWNAYNYLLKDDIPVVLTSDFLMYYFENILKTAFKDIEQSAFYNNLWEVNKSMYETALSRYKRIKNNTDLENDITLEAARFEVSFFAVGLKLLEPIETQKNKINFTDERKFTLQEVDYYLLQLPEYLKNGVIEKEVKLIREAKRVIKSPVFLYKNNYKRFNIPSVYKKNAKLNNFYLALEWMRSEFPLYYQSEECPNCLIDREDWKINMATAGFIANDLYKNLEIKNKWAIIYKVISFFSGLRQDLTYLHYNDALLNVFGEDYDVESIFSKSSHDYEENILKLQAEIAKNSFLPIGGTYTRELVENKLIGMRLLQERFWPNDFIFNELTGASLIKKTNANKHLKETACYNKEKNVQYRCKGFGLDIVNLINPIDYDYEYFVKNTDYSSYNNNYLNIVNEFDKFDKNTWNSNTYWMNFDISRYMLTKNEKYPVYMIGDKWRRKKQYNTILGSWVNIHLDGDVLEKNSDNIKAGIFSSGNNCNQYNFIEPDINLINDVLSRSEMVIDMLSALGVTEDTNTSSNILKSFINDLKDIRSIVKKELSGEYLDTEDCNFIESFVSGHKISIRGGQDFVVNTKNASMKEGIDGVNLLFVINNDKQGKKSMAVGPVFNYQESK